MSLPCAMFVDSRLGAVEKKILRKQRDTRKSVAGGRVCRVQHFDCVFIFLFFRFVSAPSPLAAYCYVRRAARRPSPAVEFFRRKRAHFAVASARARISHRGPSLLTAGGGGGRDRKHDLGN